MHLWYKYYGLFVRIYKVICSKLAGGKQVLNHVLIANVTIVRHNP